MEVCNGIWKKILVWNGIWNERFLVWNGNGMEENCQYGIRKNRFPFHTIGLPYVIFLEDMSSFLMKNNLSAEDVKKCLNVLLFGILNR